VADEPENENDFAIHYIKSPNYHELPCDGIIGGITPRGSKIWMGLYSERLAIPQTIVHAAVVDQENGTVTFDESKRPKFTQGRNGMIRTLEVCTYLDLETAERCLKWLKERVDQLKSHPHANSNVRSDKLAQKT
jgi:hypothetical protein